MIFTALATVGLYFWMSSAQFEGVVRKRLIAELEQSIGGRVEIASFHWRLLHLEADADGLVIHGSEGPGEAPYARIDHLGVSVSLLGFWSPTVRLRDLDIFRPALHLIVYPDGSTNQPHPRTPANTPTRTNLDTFFNLQASHLSVLQGFVDYDNRAATFDFQNRRRPSISGEQCLSAPALRLPLTFCTPETYRIEAGATDLNLSARSAHHIEKPVHGYFQATLDLTRSAAFLRSLRISAPGSGKAARTHSRSPARSRTFPVPTGRPKSSAILTWGCSTRPGLSLCPGRDCPPGSGRAGKDGEFRTDGNVHVEGGSYIGTGVVATGISVSMHMFMPILRDCSSLHCDTPPPGRPDRRESST